MVSIVMPTHNRAQLVKRAIESVLDQTYGDFELLVIDDASSDNTREILKNYTDSRLRVFANEKNMGANYSRNVGINSAKGDYVAFLDDDNEWMPTYLEERLKKVEKYAVDMVFGRFIDVESGNVFPANKSEDLNNFDYLYREMLIGNAIDTNTVLVEKMYLQMIGGFDEKLNRFQDWDIFFRLIGIGGFRYYFSDDVLVKYYRGLDSISGNISPVEDLCALYKKRIDVIEKYGLEKEIAQSILNRDQIPMESKIEIITRFSRMLKENSLFNMLKGEFLLCDEERKKNKKCNFIINMMSRWIENVQNGRNPIKKLKQVEINSVAIYGYGSLGKLVLRECEKNGMTIKAVIDREKTVDLKGVRSCIDLKGCSDIEYDAVIVTFMYNDDEISELEKLTDKRVIGFAELLV